MNCYGYGDTAVISQTIKKLNKMIDSKAGGKLPARKNLVGFRKTLQREYLRRVGQVCGHREEDEACG